MASLMGIPVPFLDENQTKMLLVGLGAAVTMMLVETPGVVAQQYYRR